MMDGLAHIAQLLRTRESFIIGAHLDPDGDTLGSSLALCHYLKEQGKSVRVFCDTPVPATLELLPGRELLEVPGEEALHVSAEVGLAVDAGDLARLGRIGRALVACPILVNIDHHPTNPLYGTVNVVDATASSTAELVYRMFRGSQFPMSTEVAECLYIGLASDTGCFRYPNTTPEALRMGSDLVSLGVDAAAVAESLYERRTYAFLKLLGAFLGELQLEDEGRIVWSSITLAMLRDYGVDESELEGFVTYAKMTCGVEAAIVFRELADERVKLSFRSRERLDVSALAGALGGGGHRRAAGATVDGKLSDVIPQVLGLARVALRT